MKTFNFSTLKKFASIASLIIITFMVTIFIVFKIMQNYFTTELLEETHYIANEYKLLTSISSESGKIISDLIDERLTIASNVILNQRSKLNQHYIDNLCKELKIDHISWYNNEGIIIYSTNKDYIGWKVTKNHPIEKFINSKDKSLIENIRKETLRGELYKFGYRKDNDGYFVQVGISIDSINSIVEKLNKQSIVDILSRNNPKISIILLNNQNEIIAKSNSSNIENVKFNSEEIEFIEKNILYKKIISYDNKKIFEVLIPIHSESKAKETIAVFYSLDNTEILIKKLFFFVFIFLLFIFSLSVGTILHINRNNKKIEYLAYYDPLTNLPNKDSFLKITEENKSNRNEKSSIIVIKLEKFKIINQIYGYTWGDFILKTTANYLTKYQEQNDKLIVFKYFSDKFIIYMPNINNKSQIDMIANNIFKIFKNPIFIDNQPKNISIHMSAVIFDNKNKNINEILKMAEIALEWPSNSYLTFYDESMQNNLLRKDFLKKEISDAFLYDNKKLYLVFQPQQDFKTDNIVGFEALIRFESEKFGFISPEELISIAESENLIINLGKWILKNSCRFIRKIEELNISNFRVAVNISPIQLLSDSFVSETIRISENEGIDMNHLEIEITESVIMDNFESANLKLLSLKEYGIEIALDDFGTGYSSLSRIDALNIDKLKIDKYFISKITENENHSDNLMAEAIIVLAKKLNLVIVAEGVEYDYQKEYLKQKDCDILQGYFFSRPISPDACLEMLKK